MKKILQTLSAFLVLLFIQILLTAISPAREKHSLKENFSKPGEGQKFWVFNDKG